MNFGDDGELAILTTHDPDAGIVHLLSAPVPVPNTGVTVTRHTYALDHGTIGYAAGDATSLRVIDGTLLFNESLTIGQQGNGTLIIDGEGAQLSANQGAVIAEDSYGLLWIRDGGEADITKKIVLGRNTGATGNILIENEHSSVVLQGDLTVGDAGIGNVSVLHGGIFELEELLDDDGETVAEGKTKVAAELGSQGRILVSGEDSTFVSEGGLTLGDKGNGTLEIAQAGRVTIGGNAKFGAEPVSFGIAHATGEGAQLSISGKLTLGDGGTGELVLADGATAQVRAMLIADKHAAIGELLLQDHGTRFDVAEQLEVGGAGHALVRVESAAVLTAAELTLATAASVTASSELIIEGAGSRVETGATVIGQHGIARLEIRNGARLASGRLAVLDAADPDLVIDPGVAASATIGLGSFASGYVLISGNDTSWEIGGELIVGDGGFGQLQVESGATLENDGARIGATELEGPGHVTVINPGSVWRSRREIVIAGTGTNAGGEGATGQGILEVLDGALVEAPSMTLGAGGLLVGDSRIVLAGGTGTLINEGGVVAPGASPGRLSIDGNFTQLADGILTMEIAGPDLFDQLAVSGLLTLGGTLNLAFIDDYSPVAGDGFVFEMFFSAATAGEFATVTTTGLASGLHLAFDRGSFATGQSVSFTVAPVPLPASVWMFAAGIVLLVRKMHRASSGS